MRKDTFAGLYLRLLGPLFFYWLGKTLLMNLAAQVLGSSDENYMLCQTLTCLIMIPFLAICFYLPDQRENKESQEMGTSPGNWRRSILPAMVIALLVGTGLNNLICMSPLVAVSEGYAEANRHFFAATFTVEMLASAVLTPIMEELLYRGILYGRLRRTLGTRTALIGSALVFAIMHGNLVQFLYALLMGLLFAAFLEKDRNLVIPILCHMAVNALAVCRTELGWLQGTTDYSPLAWTLSLGLLLAGLVLEYFYLRKT